jgi:2-amino-4-hydroxy-6-hydroxymethyldihydropteridine diphosphokinase
MTEIVPRTVILLIGSNIDPISNIKKAIKKISDKIQIDSQSSLWETKPIGTDGDNFFNLALAVTSSLDLNTLKFEVLRLIEIDLGRARISDKFASRTIDIDIILDGDTIIDSNIWHLAYIAVPVAELIPGLIYPETHQTLKEIASLLNNIGWIKKQPANILK